MFLSRDGFKNTSHKKYIQLKNKDRIIYLIRHVKIGSRELVWLWVDIIEPIDKEILSINISKERDNYAYSRTFYCITDKQIWQI